VRRRLLRAAFAGALGRAYAQRSRAWLGVSAAVGLLHLLDRRAAARTKKLRRDAT